MEARLDMAEQTHEAKEVRIGETVTAKVEHVAAYGAFVRLAGGQKAMIHISELSHNYVKKVEDIIAVGQEVTAKVIKIDDKGRIDLSIKALQVREPLPQRGKPEDDFEKKLSNFMKFSDEKIADLNGKTKDPRASRMRRGGGYAGKDY